MEREADTEIQGAKNYPKKTEKNYTPNDVGRESVSFKGTI